MFKFWKRDKISTSLTDTFIGEGTIVEGAIRSAGSVRLEGQLRGDLFCEGDIVLGESAFAISNMTARNMFLAGQVTGNVRISGKLTIASTGKLYGDMDAATLAIDEGGVFQGNSAMDMGEPVVSPVERRAGRDRRVADDPDYRGEERRSGHDRRDKEGRSGLLLKKLGYRADKNAEADEEDAELQAAAAGDYVDPIRENGRAFMQNMHGRKQQERRERGGGVSDEERAALGVPGLAAGQTAGKAVVQMTGLGDGQTAGKVASQTAGLGDGQTAGLGDGQTAGLRDGQTAGKVAAETAAPALRQAAVPGAAATAAVAESATGAATGTQVEPIATSAEAADTAADTFAAAADMVAEAYAEAKGTAIAAVAEAAAETAAAGEVLAAEPLSAPASDPADANAVSGGRSNAYAADTPPADDPSADVAAENDSAPFASVVLPEEPAAAIPAARADDGRADRLIAIGEEPLIGAANVLTATSAGQAHAHADDADAVGRAGDVDAFARMNAKAAIRGQAAGWTVFVPMTAVAVQTTADVHDRRAERPMAPSDGGNAIPVFTIQRAEASDDSVAAGSSPASLGLHAGETGRFAAPKPNNHAAEEAAALLRNW